MKITNERLIEILRDNFIILMLNDNFSRIDFEIISEFDSGMYNVDALAYDKVGDMTTNFNLEVDTILYDEKFADVNKYEVEDMGILIQLQVDTNYEELNEINLWKALYYNK